MDDAVRDDDRLYRYLAPGWVKPDNTVASVAYMLDKKPDPEVSVDLARKTTPQEARSRSKNPETYGIGEIAAVFPRSLDLAVEPRPIPGNPAHCQIEGNTFERPTWRDDCRKMARATNPVIHPAS